MNLHSLILLVLKASIFLTVFALGLQATFADATFLFRRPPPAEGEGPTASWGANASPEFMAPPGSWAMTPAYT